VKASIWDIALTTKKTTSAERNTMTVRTARVRGKRILSRRVTKG
jgi:hypothetical protein